MLPLADDGVGVEHGGIKAVVLGIVAVRKRYVDAIYVNADVREIGIVVNPQADIGKG